MLNPKIKAYTETVEGKAMFSIVREFLEFFDLCFTMSVYEPESYMGTSYKYDGKLAIMKDLGLSHLDENSEGPLLLQLIQLVQLHNNNNTVSKNSLRLCLSENNSNQQQTDADNSIRTDDSHTNESNVSVSDSVHINGKSEVCIPAGLNVTFDLSNPKIITEQENNRADNMVVDEHKQNDSTFSAVNGNCIEGNDESSKCIDEVNSSETSASLTNVNEDDKKMLEIDTSTQNSLLVENIADLGEFSSALKESKVSYKHDISAEKLKMASHKSDRLKTKSNVSSLADLPSLQIGRNRSSDPLILPSLYSHEFKEKTNSKELDELLGAELDSLDNYEEDFMSTSEIEPPIDCSEKNAASGSKSNRNKEDLTSDCGTSEGAAKHIGIAGLHDSS